MTTEMCRNEEIDIMRDEIEALKSELSALEEERESLKELLPTDESLTDSRYMKDVEGATNVLTGISIPESSKTRTKFVFRTSYKSKRYETCTVTIKRDENGFSLLDAKVPRPFVISDFSTDQNASVEEYIENIQTLITSLVVRREQVKELKALNDDYQLEFSVDYCFVSVTAPIVSNSTDGSLTVLLRYNKSEVYPYEGNFESDDLPEDVVSALEDRLNPLFVRHYLADAFQIAFERENK